VSLPVVGRPVSPAEQQQLTDLQGLFKPADAIKRVDEFAKWVFASIAVVGTLGAGLSNAAFQTLSGAGRVVLGAAILLVGASLFAATLALEPRWVHANLNSRDSMLAAVDVNLSKRRRPVQIAAALFALALVVSGSAPLASVVSAWLRPQRVMLNYEWKPDGKLWAQLAGVGLKAYAPVEVSVETTAAPPVEQARARKAADASGKVEATLEVILALPPGTVLQLTGHWADASGPDAPLVHKQTLSISVPVAKSAPTTMPSPPSEKKATEGPAKKPGSASTKAAPPAKPPESAGAPAAKTAPAQPTKKLPPEPAKKPAAKPQ